MTTLDIILFLVLSACLIFLIEKRKYKVRHSIYSFIFFTGAFVWTIFSNTYNKLITLVLFSLGVWHLTKACFFIETDEIEEGENQ